MNAIPGLFDPLYYSRRLEPGTRVVYMGMDDYYGIGEVVHSFSSCGEVEVKNEFSHIRIQSSWITGLKHPLHLTPDEVVSWYEKEGEILKFRAARADAIHEHYAQTLTLRRESDLQMARINDQTGEPLNPGAVVLLTNGARYVRGSSLWREMKLGKAPKFTWSELVEMHGGVLPTLDHPGRNMWIVCTPEVPPPLPVMPRWWEYPAEAEVSPAPLAT